jgi:uncharacterized ferritin-like protein (DUF455 family)
VAWRSPRSRWSTFPDAPWDIRLAARAQCWDEVRHARAFLARLIELGGYQGEFPIINQEWGVVCMFDSLAGRLAVQNRLFEGGSLDVFKEGAESWTRWGDPVTAEIMDAVAADEVQHVRFANEWFKRPAQGGPARAAEGHRRDGPGARVGGSPDRRRA